MLAATRAPRCAAARSAVATTLASPVAGLFLACRRRHGGWRAALGAGALALAAGAAATGLVLAVLFPEGGTEPFVASGFWPALAATGLAPVDRRRGAAPLRIGARCTACCSSPRS